MQYSCMFHQEIVAACNGYKCSTFVRLHRAHVTLGWQVSETLMLDVANWWSWVSPLWGSVLLETGGIPLQGLSDVHR